MKNWQQITKVLLLISIYCFGICVSTKTLPYVSAQANEHNNKHNGYLTAASKVFYFHNQQSENILTTISEYSILDFKLPVIGFWIISSSNEILLNAKYKQYINHFKTTLIRQRKSNLIFPFHNFW